MTRTAAVDAPEWFAGWEASGAADRQERAAARVHRHADEQWLVDRVTAYLVQAARVGDGSFLAEWARVVLTDAGIRATDCRTRRRILSTAICDGKRAGRWRASGLVLGQARRGVTRWRLVEDAP